MSWFGSTSGPVNILLGIFVVSAIAVGGLRALANRGGGAGVGFLSLIPLVAVTLVVIVTVYVFYEVGRNASFGPQVPISAPYTPVQFNTSPGFAPGSYSTPAVPAIGAP
jgi:hypothetical protein